MDGPSCPLSPTVTWKRLGLGTLEDGAEIFRVGIVSNPWPGEPKMYVELKGSLAVLFPKGPPAFGGLLIQTLQRLSNIVEAILLHFESEFR
jgi:hypothetical protein